MEAMAASIGHEIVQPISAMLLNTDAANQWLSNAPPNIDGARAALRRVANEGQRASDVITAIRSMFKKGAHGRVQLSANEIVREALAAVDLSLRQQQVSLQIDLRDDLPKLMGDRGQLHQVFLNLITNAIEAMGSVNGRKRVLRVSSDVIQDSSDVAVTIEDNGTGIESKNENQIFESFFTTKPTGTGIGLTICQSIIEVHDGTLRASANKPYGTIFRVTLPGSPT
jgi:C4-dicarboxylate-specific signal transduction histidine kinase